MNSNGQLTSGTIGKPLYQRVNPFELILEGSVFANDRGLKRQASVRDSQRSCIQANFGTKVTILVEILAVPEKVALIPARPAPLL